MNLKSKQFQSIIPGKSSSIEVNYDLNFALRKLKRMQKDSNIIVECYDNKFFHKKSDVKRKQLEIARYLQMKEAEKG